MGILSIPPVSEGVPQLEVFGGEAARRSYQMRSFWYGEITGSALKGRELQYLPHLQRGTDIGTYPDVSRLAFGGFAAGIRVWHHLITRLEFFLESDPRFPPKTTLKGKQFL